MLSIRDAGVEESASVSTEAVVMPTIGTLLGTGAVVSLVCRSPDAPFTSWTQLMERAVGYVLLAAGVHVAAIWLVDRVYGRSYAGQKKAPPGQVMRGTWMCAGLLPVTVLLAHAGSGWAAVVLPAIAMVAVLFVLRAAPEAGRLARSGAPAGIASGLFRYEAPAALLRTLRTMVLVAVMLEVGAVMLLSWEYALAGLLFGLCGVMVLWRVPVRPRVAAGAGLRVAVATAVVLLLTILALLPSLGGSRMAGRVGRFVGPPVQAKATVPEVHAGAARGGALSGVILTLPPKPKEKVLPPAPRSALQMAGAGRRVQTIPFDGAYWYFRASQLRPREDARRVRGDPTKVEIHSTDMVALRMEAHQRLAPALLTDCCAAIRVSVRNAEGREGAIGMELVLSENAGKAEWRRSLGTKLLRTSLQPRGPGEEVLEFAVPEDLPRGEMDEMTLVVVVPAGERARRGSRVAVESFALVGR